MFPSAPLVSAQQHRQRSVATSWCARALAIGSLFQSCVLVLICRPVKSHPVLTAQRNLGVQFHLECTYISLVYYDYQPAKEHIQKAQQLCGLNISMTGGFVEGLSWK